MKQTINSLLAILVALAVMVVIAGLLPDYVYAQTGTGPHGQKFYDYNNAIIAIPNNLDPAVTSPVCTKNGVFGIYNGTVYLCVDNVWRRITMASVTPTPTATATATFTPTPTPTP